MRTSSRTPALVAVAVSAFAMWLGYLNKARCAAPPFDPQGRSTRFDALKDATVCYSDIQQLWIGRGINLHLFPFVDGALTRDGLLTGGAVEYPVLSGMLMWLGALRAHTDAEFLLHSALLLAPFGLLVAWLLGRLAGWAALLWAATPPLLMYGFLNWDLPVVATSVGAVALLGARRWPLRARAVAAAVLLAVGFCLKVYPGIFVLPLVLYVLTGGDEPGPRRDVRGAVAVAVAAATTVVVVNLPFALLGYTGWRASFEYQQNRAADATSNSIWYWGLRPLVGGYRGTEVTGEYNDIVSVVSPLSIGAAFALALWLGWRRYRREGSYPWVATSAAMLCGFLLLHKVHSPQYTLWLLPFLALLRVRWPLLVAYLTVDLAIGIGVFRWFDATMTEGDTAIPLLLTLVGVWGRAALLVALFFVFAGAPLRGRAAAPPGEEKHRTLAATADPR